MPTPHPLHSNNVLYNIGSVLGKHGKLALSTSSVTCPPQKIDKVLIKAACKRNLKEVKTFVLRNLDLGTIQSVTDLKMLIRSKLNDDLNTNFDVGYCQGTSVIRVRSKEDLLEMWAEIRNMNRKHYQKTSYC